jgi:hypothetical protein
MVQILSFGCPQDGPATTRVPLYRGLLTSFVENGALTGDRSACRPPRFIAISE